MELAIRQMTMAEGQKGFRTTDLSTKNYLVDFFCGPFVMNLDRFCPQDPGTSENLE